ncbi:UDP-glycosyltransferase 90A1-like isoform X2 [Gastrolobium bilobum]|uniref:UDP-glycosyltransferase 90A1-like isoform X2 n=1 Tax=Gastrolobium bilobum TaxID=150636 RepID=UPI002AB210EE|nr:UDP-glycosyltransferase 90A1-like isoform X2 [Gastrolobium bilobum]
MGLIPSDSSCPPHVVLFPFMSKGHTIPLLHFARILLHRRDTAVTVFTTPANRPFIAESLNGTAATIITLPFPENIASDIPNGIESTDKLPSICLFCKFAMATEAMQPHFEEALKTLPRVSFMVTDGFLWWTLESATKFSVPRFVYFGMNCYSLCLSMEAMKAGIFSGSQPDDELVTLTRFPWIRLSKEDFDPAFRNREPDSLENVFNMKSISSTLNSSGILVNSFYELEPKFVDYLNTESSPKNWCIGPLCLSEQTPKIYSESDMKPTWVRWLDQKSCSVLYVAFGSQAEISQEQIKEIAIGLEESMVNFLWVVRKDDEWGGLPDGFEERVKGRGMVVREWVDQREILMHESVEGFLSHCGWNSVLESICAGVPILAWPMMAEQPLNARMVVDEIKVGLRVETSNGSVKGFVKWEGVRNKVRELMEEEKGREARKKVRELAQMAKVAVQEGGSSWSTLHSLLQETCFKKEKSPV